jgi:hypothetical protein
MGTHNPAASLVRGSAQFRSLPAERIPASGNFQNKKEENMSAAEVMSASRPTAQPPLTEGQLKDFRIASNRVSLESIRYAAEIVGFV